MKKKLMSLGLTMAMAISLAACGGSGDSNNSSDAAPAEKTSAPEATTAAQPTDLTGTWQSEDNDGSYQEAIITDDTIEINWVSDGTESIYWIGTYTAPTEAVDEYSWTSERDKEKTDSALLASTDDTKDFTYKNDTISYEASALGTTTTMELKKVSDDTAGAAAEDAEAAAATTTVDQINLDNSEGTLVYTMHELSEDYDGNPAIIVYFDYTNKKDDTSFAHAIFYPQVFQNGVECEMGISLDDNEALSNASKEIQKDTTLNVAYIYTLQDTESPVTLKVTDQSSENLLNDVYQEQELTLK